MRKGRGLFNNILAKYCKDIGLIYIPMILNNSIANNLSSN